MKVRYSPATQSRTQSIRNRNMLPRFADATLPTAKASTLLTWVTAASCLGAHSISHPHMNNYQGNDNEQAAAHPFMLDESFARFLLQDQSDSNTYYMPF